MKKDLVGLFLAILLLLMSISLLADSATASVITIVALSTVLLASEICQLADFIPEEYYGSYILWQALLGIVIALIAIFAL